METQIKVNYPDFLLNKQDNPARAKLPNPNKSKLSSPKYSVWKPSITTILNHELLPPWLQDIELKPIGYRGNGVNIADFWSLKQRHDVMKTICHSTIKSKIGKVFHEADGMDRKKHLEEKFSKRDINSWRHRSSSIPKGIKTPGPPSPQSVPHSPLFKNQKMTFAALSSKVLPSHTKTADSRLKHKFSSSTRP
ncbi:unnamed protein product [Blepharisma stoltei]|uniref:Uncharacterized protein n=1 Tax=Blepharisma stoltei TaxID=1481888 RepID=A0AAU9JQP2_9CILI|nr:unnamed protein product [Blepharisma stoltei]